MTDEADPDPDYEAEYNNRARVPEHPQILDRWAASAAAFRAGLCEQGRADLDLAYGPHRRHRIDLFRPEHDRNGPIALLIHGGYWQALDRRDVSHMAGGLLTHDVPVAAMSYRLCPEVTIAEIVADARAAALWLWRRHGRRLLAVGHSAGGHLAACLLAANWRAEAEDLPDHFVPAAVAVSGLFDLEPLIHTSVNERLRLSREAARQASPLSWPAPAGAWLECFVGAEESDEYRRQSDSICKVWGGHGTETKLRVVPGTNHFTVAETLADAESEPVTRIAMLAHSLE